MLDRLLQPRLICTELALSALLVLAGVGMHYWGDGPGSPRAGTFIAWVGVVLLVLFGLFWLVMVHRRRTTPPSPPGPAGAHQGDRPADPLRRQRRTLGSVGLILALAVVFLPSFLGLPDDQWWPGRIIQVAGYALTGASIVVLTEGSRWQRSMRDRAERQAEDTASANGAFITTDVASSALIRLDRRRRPSMKFGPLWWWLVALVAAGAIGVAGIMALQRAGNPAWRLSAFAYGALVVVLVTGFLIGIRRRGQRYLVELKTRGLRHGKPAPEAN